MHKELTPCSTTVIVLAAALVAAVLEVHMCGASYSCCSEEQRGTVCTLAGSGAAASIDSSNPTAAAINLPMGVALYPPHSIIVTGYNECRLRVIHHNGTVSTTSRSWKRRVVLRRQRRPSRCPISISHWRMR